MEGDETVENLSRSEQAIVGLLTFHYVEGFKFEFPKDGQPLLTDLKKQTLVSCRGILKMSANFYRFHTPENESDRTGESLGALFYVLTGIALAEDEITLYSDRYSSPGELSDEGKGLWDQLVFLGLAQDLEDIRYYQLILPPAENIRNLHNKARAKALAIYSTGKISEAINEIQARLRKPAAGEIMGKPE